MKTEIVSQPEQKPAPVTFPVLYRDKENGNIVLATTERSGVIIYVKSAQGFGAGLGHTYGPGSQPWEAPEVRRSWERITGPVTITFTP